MIHFREGTSSPQMSSTGTSSEIGEIVTGSHPNHGGEDLLDNQWTGRAYPPPGQGQPFPGNWSNPNQESGWTNSQQYWTNQQLAQPATVAQPQQSFAYGSQDATGVWMYFCARQVALAVFVTCVTFRFSMSEIRRRRNTTLSCVFNPCLQTMGNCV